MKTYTFFNIKSRIFIQNIVKQAHVVLSVKEIRLRYPTNLHIEYCHYMYFRYRINAEIPIQYYKNHFLK